MNDRPRAIAALLTAVIAVLAVLLLRLMTISADMTPREWPPRHDGEIAVADEEYFDVLSPVPVASAEEAAAANAPVPETNHSEPAPESGHDVADRGPAGDAPSHATTRRESPVKKPVKKPEKPAGPTKEEREAAAREEARRRANSATRSAFQRSEGANNTASKGRKDGNSGKPDGTSSSLNGHGTGRVGGGWIMPSYARVPSTVTGSIRLEVKIDRQGNVTRVSFTGGNPPAATDTRLRQAVEREVRSRRFSRSDGSEAPASATAYITYTFR